MTEPDTFEAGGIRVARLAAEGPPLGSERDATDIIGSLFGLRVDLVAIPADRLDGGFFRLATGMAGAFVQKFVTYGYQLAVVGDIGGFTARSETLRAFVAESNKGRHLWFVDSDDALVGRLEQTRKGRV